MEAAGGGAPAPFVGIISVAGVRLPLLWSSSLQVLVPTLLWFWHRRSTKEDSGGGDDDDTACSDGAGVSDGEEVGN